MMIFHWSLTDSKSPQVFRILFSILVDYNNAVVLMVSFRFSISNSSSFSYQAFGDCYKHTNYYFTLSRVFHTSISWWSFTRVWETASFLKSAGLFSVFWPILTVRSSGCSQLVPQFPTHLVHLPSLWGLFQVHQLQLVYYFNHLRVFHQLMVFKWSLSSSKTPQVSWTHLSILADLHSAVVSMVFTRVFISNSSSPLTILWWLYRAYRLLLS